MLGGGGQGASESFARGGGGLGSFARGGGGSAIFFLYIISCN